MKKTSNKIVFFGNERLATGVTTAARTLQSLIEAGYDVAAVVANYERGQSRSARSLEVAEVAEAHNIPILTPNKPADIMDELRSYKASAGILVAYGRIVPQSVIDVFPKGIINIHPSLLPLHRGPTPIESVILDGGTETGVSLMALSKEMDAGQIYGQITVPLTGTDVKQVLADALLEVGSAMMISMLPHILNGDITLHPQDESKANYDKLITKDDGILDWNKPALRLEREVRAYAGWPKSRTKLGDIEIIVTGAHAVPTQAAGKKPGDISVLRDWGGTIMVTAGSGSFYIDSLKPVGKSEMSVEAFLKGYKF